MKKIYCVIFGKYRKSKNPNYQVFSTKHEFSLLFTVSAKIQM